MPYDLYGQFYASERDAINAEMAQCAAIDADIANRKVEELEKQLYNQRQPTQQEYEISHLWSMINELKERIEKLENK